MSLRRLFWQGAAGVLVLGALLAISAVLGAGAGEKTWKALATLGLALVCGSTALASLACLERGVLRGPALGGVLVATAAFVLWTEELWAEHESDGYWKLLGVLGVWTIAALITTALRLVAYNPRVLVGLYRPTVVAAWAGALTATAMILRENGDGWQLLAVLGILAGLGSLLTPVAQKLLAPQAEAAGGLRPLGVFAGVELLAGPQDSVAGNEVVVASGRGRLRIRADGRELNLDEGDVLVVRPLA